MDTGNLSDFFDDSEFAGDASPDDIFRILEALDGVSDFNQTAPMFSGETAAAGLGLKDEGGETEAEGSLSPRNYKRQKTSASTTAASTVADDVINPSSDEQQPRMSHITVERNRRKQMNGHLSVLRSLMPCFYVKRVCIYIFKTQL